jgi:hypothetical protein
MMSDEALVVVAIIVSVMNTILSLKASSSYFVFSSLSLVTASHLCHRSGSCGRAAPSLIVSWRARRIGLGRKSGSALRVTFPETVEPAPLILSVLFLRHEPLKFYSQNLSCLLLTNGDSRVKAVMGSAIRKLLPRSLAGAKVVQWRSGESRKLWRRGMFHAFSTWRYRTYKSSNDPSRFAFRMPRGTHEA